jgi:two-component system, LytTR family, response regulator
MCVINPEIWRRLSTIGFAKLLSIFIFPEIISLFITLALLHGYHSIFGIRAVVLSLKSILLYQLKILPVFLIAYFFFYPFTFFMRYVIIHYSDGSMNQYFLKLNEMMMVESYFLYMPAVLVLGYILLNVSLTHDYFSQSANNIVVVSDHLKTAPLIVSDHEKPTYLNVLKVRGPMGDTFLKADDCFYFEAADHSSLVYHSDGTFRIGLSITTLSKQLNPGCFFKNNPKYIINLAYLDSYIYTEKGQYALHFKIPIKVNMTTTKSKIEALRNAFQKYRATSITKSSPALSATD